MAYINHKVVGIYLSGVPISNVLFTETYEVRWRGIKIPISISYSRSGEQQIGFDINVGSKYIGITEGLKQAIQIFYQNDQYAGMTLVDFLDSVFPNGYY